mgnify:FL=1
MQAKFKKPKPKPKSKVVPPKAPPPKSKNAKKKNKTPAPAPAPAPEPKPADVPKALSLEIDDAALKTKQLNQVWHTFRPHAELSCADFSLVDTFSLTLLENVCVVRGDAVGSARFKAYVRAESPGGGKKQML